MSQRVLASSLKPALQVAAAKQVAAAGKTVKTAQVTFVGKQAYAVWDEIRWDRPDRAFRINYPALADDALLSRVEADLVAAYTLHETGHVMFTCNHSGSIETLCGSKGVTRTIAHPISNGLEDGRMENAVINAGVARNAKFLFGRMLNKLTVDLSGGWNPCDFVHAAFTCAMLSREAYGNGNSTTANLLSRIPEPKRSLYAWVMDQCKFAPKGFDEDLWAYKTAIEFVLRWRALEKDKPRTQAPPPPPPQPQPEQDEEPDLDGDDHDDSLEDTEFEDSDEIVEPEEPEEQGDEEGGSPSNPWGDDEPEDGESSEPEEDGEPCEDGEDGEDGGGDADEEGEGEGDDGDGDDGIGDEDGDSDGADGEESDGAGRGGNFDFNDVDSNGYETPKEAEPGVDDIFKRANKRAEGSAKAALPSIDPAAFEDALDYIKQQVAARHLNDKPYLGWEA